MKKDFSGIISSLGWGLLLMLTVGYSANLLSLQYQYLNFKHTDSDIFQVYLLESYWKLVIPVVIGLVGLFILRKIIIKKYNETPLDILLYSPELAMGYAVGAYLTSGALRVIDYGSNLHLIMFRILNMDNSYLSYSDINIRMIAQNIFLGASISLPIILFYYCMHLVLDKSFREDQMERNLYKYLSAENQLKAYLGIPSVIIGSVGIFIFMGIPTQTYFIIVIFIMMIIALSLFIDVLSDILNIINLKNSTELLGVSTYSIMSKTSENINKIIADEVKSLEHIRSNKSFNEEIVSNMAKEIDKPVGLLSDESKRLLENYDKDTVKSINRIALDLKDNIEDLFEISKANTNTLKLNLAKVNIRQILDQALGEHGEELLENGLTLVKGYEDDFYAEIDGEKFYKSLKGIVTSICNNSLNGTRVYVVMEVNEESARIIFKNVSRDELIKDMEQFIFNGKGDLTGKNYILSRALLGVQGAKLSIKVDGDLFKTEIEVKGGGKNE